jgi:hypothetical protein
MTAFASSEDGAAILRVAHDEGASHITMRLRPEDSDEKDGAYMVLLLDWDEGIILKLVLNHPEISGFTAALQDLEQMSVLDSFEVEGSTIQ